METNVELRGDNELFHLSSKLYILIIVAVLLAVGSSLFIYYFIHQGGQPTTTTTSSIISATQTTATSTTPPTNPSTIELELKISAKEGHETFRNLGIIDVKDIDSVMFRVIESRVEGLSSIALSGVVKLESEDSSYTIDMPCMLWFNCSCPRITLIIPGYDAPLNIKAGRYLLTIEFYWREASDVGKVYLKFTPRAYRASIIPIGEYAPEDTTNWISVNGSTRSYAMLLNRIEAAADQSGFGDFTVYVWMFDQSGEEFKEFRFELTSLERQELVEVLETTVKKNGPYYRILLLVKARPGYYNLSLTNPVKLSTNLKVM